jgi:hypothetical protein
MKENEIILFAGKWMEVEIIMLRKTNHTQKDKYNILSLTHEI